MHINQYMNRTFNYQKFELWIATLALGIFVFVMLLQCGNAENITSHEFEANNTRFDFYRHVFIPYLVQAMAYYGVFIYLTQYLETREWSWTTIWNYAGIYLILAMIISVTRTYSDAWIFGAVKTNEQAYRYTFSKGFTNTAIIFFFYLIYMLAKKGVSFLIKNRSVPREKKLIVRNIIFALLGWLFVLILMASNSFHNFFIACWVVAIPYSIVIVLLNLYQLIPMTPVKKMGNRFYLSRFVPIGLVLNLVASILFIAVMGVETAMTLPAFFILLIWTGLFVVPFSWYYYNTNSEKEILQSALGSSQANLSFLRSQINPHFLFNALNTLYGTALQENAERTSEGIQKLGDMMRFMLHENGQDKISLTREVEYLTNYVALQKLRTVNSKDITIQTQIQEQLNNLQIAPMLLIPFVENAFKHGISLKEPSYIKLSLQTKENILYFDVHNSTHIKADNDPEKLKSGIGLQNVKQRLALLYPGRHELIIRESAKEYFVHLTLTL